MILLCWFSMGKRCGSVDQPVLLDGLHPTSQTSRALAELAVPIAVEQLESFGFM